MKEIRYFINKRGKRKIKATPIIKYISMENVDYVSSMYEVVYKISMKKG